MNTIDKFLTNSSKSHPEKLALIDENSKFTFLELEEKVKRKSGIGYKRTGRKIKDQQYIDSARASEITRKEDKRGTGLENVS